MNLVIFDGGNYAVSMNKLGEIKEPFEREAITQVSLKNLSFEQFLIDIRTPSLFADKRLVIVNDADEKKIDLEQLTGDDNLTVVLIFSKELGTSSKLWQLAQKKKARMFTFSQPQDKSVFQFLDHIGEKNTKAIGEFEQLYLQFGGQYLLTMLLYLFRRLVLPTNSKSFGASKVENQKKNFSIERIADCYFQILQTDYLIKSGKVEEKTALLLLVNLLIT